MMKEEYCRVLCLVEWTSEDVEDVQRLIREQYHHNWVVDGLPAASNMNYDQYLTTEYTGGYPIGYMANYNEYYLYNHVNIILEYLPLGGTRRQIVRFYVEPLSVRQDWYGTRENPALISCNLAKQHLTYQKVQSKPQKVASSSDTGIRAHAVVFTYDVQWRETDVQWTSRWDLYLTRDHAVPDNVHCFSIFNTIMIILFLSIVVVTAHYRALHGEPAQNNNNNTNNTDNNTNNTVTNQTTTATNNHGLKRVRTEVFRPPSTCPLLFCVLVGTGVQLSLCLVVVLLLAAVGYLRPEQSGSILIGLLLCFVQMSVPAGFVSASLYNAFTRRTKNRLCALLTVTLCPGAALLVYLSLTLLVWSVDTTAQFVPLLSLLSLVAVWLLVSVPLVFLGAYFADQRQVMQFPITPNPIPRPIPVQPWHLHPLWTAGLGGMLCYGAISIELFFIMSSLWLHWYYSTFGYLLLTYLLLLVVSAQAAVVIHYHVLQREDYRWWWRSLFTPGASAVFVFYYAISFVYRLQAENTLTYVLYFSCMAIFSAAVFLVTGSMGFLACFYFNYVVYSALRNDEIDEEDGGGASLSRLDNEQGERTELVSKRRLVSIAS